MLNKNLKDHRIIAFQIYSMLSKLKSLACTSQIEPDVSIKYTATNVSYAPSQKLRALVNIGKNI